MGTTELEGYAISTDPKRLDIQAIHAFLTTSYWATGIPIDVVRKWAASRPSWVTLSFRGCVDSCS